MSKYASNNSLNASGSLRQNLDGESIYELQKILNDERKRAAEHKLNYQQIKSELCKLQEINSRLEYDYATIIETHKNEMDENQRKVQKMNRTLSEAQREIEDLKVNQVTEKRIELIRLKIEEQFESVYQERLARCTSDCDAIRSEMSRFKTENTFLKAEYEHQHKEHKRVIEEMTLIHQSEISTLKSEKNRLIATSIEIPQESVSFKELTKENGVLRSQMKDVLNELQESRAKLDHEKTQADQELRAKKKQLSEVTSSCRKLELEIESLKKQLTNNQKELASRNMENANLQFSSNETDRANKMIQNRLDELTQKAKVELTQLKLESAKQKRDIERQKDLLAAKIEELEYQLRLAGTKCGQLETQLQEREKSIAKREAGIKETEWARVQQLENDKLELDSQIRTLQTALREEKNSMIGKFTSLEERAQKSEQSERVLEKERDSNKQKLESSLAEIKNLKNSLNEFKNQFVQQEAELDECYNRLAAFDLMKKEKTSLQEQIKDLKIQLKEAVSGHDKVLIDKDSQWSQDIERHRQKIKELEEELSKTLEKNRLLQEELRRKNKKHSNYFNKQKKQLQITLAMKEELQAENELLKNNVSSEDFSKLCRELKDLRRRHQEYQNLIMQSDRNPALNVEFPQYESRYETSLEQLKKRLDVLDEKQQQQIPQVLHLQESEKRDVEKSELLFGPRGDNS